MQDSVEPHRSRRSGARGGDTRAGHARGAIAEATCAGRVIVLFARELARIGCDGDAWLAGHGLSLAQLKERDVRVPHAVAHALLGEAVALSGDPAIGIRAARIEGPGNYDVVEYAAANCASVGEALLLAARFIALQHDGITMELDVAAPMAALRVRGLPGLPHIPAGMEFMFAVLLAYGSRSVGHPTRPLRVEFTHPGPTDPAVLAVYEQAFREVRFNCEVNAMWLASAALERPHSAADPALMQILTNHADDLLRQLARPPRFADRARGVIAQTLLAGHASADQVARRLAVSLRTLHRRLAEDGTSHGELVDDVRREQAMLHLAGNRFSIGEISFLLGFGHPNAFHKAFKRWTRMTPAQYRDERNRQQP